MTLMSLPLMPVTTSPGARPAAAAELEASTAATRIPPVASVNKLGVPAAPQLINLRDKREVAFKKNAPQTSSARRAATNPRLPDEDREMDTITADGFTDGELNAGWVARVAWSACCCSGDEWGGDAA